MRVSTMQFSLMMLQTMQRNTAELAETSNQIGTGKRLSTAADDPIDAVKLLHIGQELSGISQYKDNIVSLELSLAEQDTLLSGMNNNLQRVREIVLLAGNGSYGDSERLALSNELDVLASELLSLGNYKKSDGQYLFSGTEALIEPIQQSGSGFEYNGNDEKRWVNINSSSLVEANNTAHEMFFDVGLGVASATGRNVTQYNITDQSAFAGWNQVSVSYDGTASPPTLTIGYLDADGNSISAPVVNNSWTPDSVIVLDGVEITLDQIPAAADSFNFTLAKEDIFTQLEAFSAELKSPGVPPTLVSRLQAVDMAIGKVSSVQTDIGGRMNALELSKNSLEDIKLMSEILQSELEDLDYAEATTRLNRQELVLQASQQAYAAIQGLSLFNYIR